MEWLVPAPERCAGPSGHRLTGGKIKVSSRTCKCSPSGWHYEWTCLADDSVLTAPPCTAPPTDRVFTPAPHVGLGHKPGNAETAPVPDPEV